MEFPTIQHPSSMLISGPSNSGKTYFVKKLLDYEMFKPTPSKIIWCYGAYQTLFDEISNVEFIDGLPSDLSQISNALIIIDDLMSELGGDKKLSNLFTKGAEFRTISLNASYMCCFKNVRDKMQMASLAKQMYPSQTKYFQESFKDATSVAYGYLFIDLRPETDEKLRLRTGLFPEDENIFYQPR
ncbi:uncharacterized protein TNCV_4725361 [Trichonephila clavipes]|uniref:Uncharacterized protein n=1 Tax=Trichonephila clavipes TaxID=2585209 RepID=A0A8X6W753_TRICX|nr:uncharacterized protein TNCV_2709691 [Trichonephila clavipes]GFT87505.1 uncharacterized protein TNCV_1638921 [Trichonephila clavipes]GFX32822.1 uncharacterized protein TNCV_889581 [Trichonephila clavipes]GFY29409.1 uncharacterized protein TNCV_4725361 [Trichonephila clavipes]